MSDKALTNGTKAFIHNGKIFTISATDIPFQYKDYDIVLRYYSGTNTRRYDGFTLSVSGTDNFSHISNNSVFCSTSNMPTTQNTTAMIPMDSQYLTVQGDLITYNDGNTTAYFPNESGVYDNFNHYCYVVPNTAYTGSNELYVYVSGVSSMNNLFKDFTMNWYGKIDILKYNVPLRGLVRYEPSPKEYPFNETYIGTICSARLSPKAVTNYHNSGIDPMPYTHLPIIDKVQDSYLGQYCFGEREAAYGYGIGLLSGCQYTQSSTFDFLYRGGVIPPTVPQGYIASGYNVDSFYCLKTPYYRNSFINICNSKFTDTYIAENGDRFLPRCFNSNLTMNISSDNVIKELNDFDCSAINCTLRINKTAGSISSVIIGKVSNSIINGDYIDDSNDYEVIL